MITEHLRSLAHKWKLTFAAAFAKRTDSAAVPAPASPAEFSDAHSADGSPASFNLRSLSLQIIGLLIPITAYVIVLNATLPARLLYHSSYSLILMTPSALLLGIFLNRRLAGTGTILCLTLMFSLFALPLNSLWSHVAINADTVGGLLPFSDAGGYYFDARRLLDGHLIGWSSRRPLFTGLLASLLLLTGRNLQVTLAILVAVNVAACYLLARELQFAKNTVAAAAAIILYFLFYRVPGIGGLGITLTENLGLPLGALALSILLRGFRTARFPIIWSGLSLLTVALCARAGAFFVLPALLLAGAWAYRGQTRFSSRFFVGGLVAIVLGFTLDSALRTFAGNSDEAFSNFSYVLYGLVIGGKGWGQVLIDHPGALPTEIYTLAWQAFIANPTGIVSGAIKHLNDYLPPNGYHAFSFIYATGPTAIRIQYLCYLLSFLGLVRCFRSYRTPLSLAIIAGFLGHLASIPFVPPNDAGIRVYAATMPFIFTLAAFGAGWIAEMLGGLFRLIRPHRAGQPGPGFQALASPATPIAAIALGLVLVLLTVALPLLIRVFAHEPRIAQSSCANGLTPVYVRLDPGSSIQILESRPKLEQLLHTPGIAAYPFGDAAQYPSVIKIGRPGRYVRVQLADTNYLNLAEVEILSSKDGEQINLARGKPATQSSIDENEGEARRAVDGNSSGNWSDLSITHTSNEFQPWWEVDLRDSDTIEEIALWNRPGYEDRLQNFYILISEAPFLDKTPVRVPQIRDEDLRKTAGVVEIRNDIDNFRASNTMMSSFDLVTGRLIWLIVPTQELAGKSGIVKVCGRDSEDQQSKRRGVFYARQVESVKVGR